MAEEVIGLLFGVAGGGSIDGESGRRIVEELTQIVNSINGGNNAPKIKFQFDTTEATKAVNDLKGQLGDIAKLANFKASQGGGHQGKSTGNATQDLQKQIEKYRELSAVIKKWVQDSKTAAKLSQEYAGLSRNVDGSIVGTGSAENYDETIASINRTAEALKELQIEFVQADDASNGIKKGDVLRPNEKDFRRIASEIGITEEQYKKLFNQMQTGAASAQQSIQNAHRTSQNAWDKQVRNVSQQIDQMYDTISKDPTVKRMADDLRKYMQAGSGDVGDLKNRFDALTRAASESGANITTWGDKFKKTFAGKVRSALAGAITAAFTKYLRDIYKNVVEIDKATVDLQIATGKTRQEVKQLVKEYAQLGKQLGASTVDITEAADTWLRQGYGLEQVNELITNSTMLAKLGKMEASDSSKALTSAMKGYKVEVEDSIKIVDKLTAVDMEAAASAGDIATAMAETATGADIAGVSMDKLIGYITTVKEVTQDGAESVGTFYKTLFARMNNVAAGKFVDDETGESLNDVETVLGELDIALRNVDGTFRNSGEVLDDVAKRWTTFDNVQQHAIATAFAGTRQQEKFIVLMENYETAMKYSATATNSAGTAAQKYEGYLEGIGGKLSTLKAIFEELSITVLNSEWIIGGVQVLSIILEGLTAIAGVGDGVVIAIIAISTALFALSASLQLARKKIEALKVALSTLKINPWILAIEAVIVAVALATTAIKNYTDASTEAAEKAKEHAQAMKDAADKAAQERDSLEELAARYEELKSKGDIDSDSRKEIRDIQKQINILVKGEASEWDMVNGALDDNLKKIKEVRAEMSKKTLESSYQSYIAAQSSANNAYESDRSGAGWAEWAGDLGGNDLMVKGWDEEAVNILDSLKGVWAERNTVFTHGITNIQFTANSAQEYIDRITDAMNALSDPSNSYDYLHSDVYNKLYSLRSEYEAYISRLEETAGQLVNDVVFDTGTTLQNGGITVDTAEDYETFRQSMIDAATASGYLNDALASQVLTQDEIISAVDDYMAANYPELYNQIANNVANSTGRLKTFYEILEDVQGKYDILSKSLDDMNEYGYLTTETLSKLLDPENGYPALSKYLTMTANGYTIASDALELFIKEEQDAYVKALVMAQEGSEAYDIAYQNLERFIAVISSLRLSKEIERETKALEKEKDAWEDQLDKYKELIEMRKELLKTYEEELAYQKELEKRQRNVANLQTKLSVARLDSSAAGQARVRELEAELREAQEELEDFTLEHAIDMLTNQLDNQYNEYENFIETKLSQITAAINGVKASITGGLSNFETLISELVKGYGNSNSNNGSDNGAPHLTEGKVPYRDEWASYWSSNEAPPPTPTGWKPRWTSYQDAVEAGYSNILGATPSETVRAAMEYGSYQKYLDAMYQKYYLRAPSYHIGGFVGNMSSLASNEEFAKLLKGEFVSTPAQMKRFMEETLPRIANYTTSGGTNEFNAPLIEITCESATTEVLPKLKQIVNEAVNEIKHELDSGMSRTGFKRPTTRRLT